MAKKNIKKIQVVGPKDSASLAEILRVSREGKKKDIELVKGQYLSVGKDGELTETEAQRLLNSQTWEIKEVEE